jgi:hypothetical protein
MRSELSFVGCSVLVARQDLISDRINSAVNIDVKVYGVRLIHEVCHFLVVGSEPF